MRSVGNSPLRLNSQAVSAPIRVLPKLTQDLNQLDPSKRRESRLHRGYLEIDLVWPPPTNTTEQILDKTEGPRKPIENFGLGPR